MECDTQSVVSEHDATLPLSAHDLVQLFDGIADAVLVQDRDGTIVFANDTAARLCGALSAAVMVGKPIGDVLRGFEIRDEAAAPFPVALLPARRVLAGESAAHAIIRYRTDPGGAERWAEDRATAIRDSTGAVRYAASIFRDITDQKRAELALQDENRVVTTLLNVGTTLISGLDLERVVQAVTDAATALTGAQFGSFFYNVINDAGESYTLYTLSGVPREAFSRFPMPRNTAIFGPTFRGEGVVRLADVTRDPRYGANPPYNGMPPGHLPVCSYLAAPVTSSSGEVLGGLFFGHARPDVFSEESERIVVGIAAHAAVAIENARLYDAERRARTEAEMAEARYRALFDQVGDPILVTDAQARYIDANPAATALLGYTRAELLQMHVPQVVAQPEDETAAMFAQFLSAGQWRGELSLRRKDGTDVVVDALAAPVAMAGGTRYVSVIRDITERKLRERMQHEFISMVSHELRTPLTSLKGYLDLMHRRGTYDERSMRIIARQTDRMTRLLNDVVETSRLDAHHLDLKLQAMDLGALVRQCVADAAELLGSHSVRILVPDHPITGMWDSDRLCEVLQNLLTNAAKYSPEDSEIVVRAEAGDDLAHITVTDQGVGIPAEALPHVFDRFYLATNARERNVKGMGLGLYISKGLIEAHGGAIEVKSAPGEGSIFSFTLPYNAPLT